MNQELFRGEPARKRLGILGFGVNVALLAAGACSDGGGADEAANGGASGAAGSRASGGSAGSSDGSGGEAGAAAGSSAGRAGSAGSGGSDASGGSGNAGSSGEAGAAGKAGAGGDGGGPDCSAGCPEGLHDIDADAATGDCGCEYACTPLGESDPFDPFRIDSNCDGGDGVVDECVYVSALKAPEEGAPDGTRSRPFPTITAAVSHAKQTAQSSVCVAGETFYESVLVESGISLYGGFDANDPVLPFRRSPSAKTIVEATVVAFHTMAIEQTSVIEGFTMSVTADGTPGQSTYGVMHRGGAGKLIVRNNVIEVGPGNAGSNGASGAPVPAAGDGANGVLLYGGVTTCALPETQSGKGGAGFNYLSPSTTPTAGEPGAMGGGAAGPAGAMLPCPHDLAGVDGGRGGDGAPGLHGAPGLSGSQFGTIASLLGYLPSDGTAGANGTHGKGGGGGGGGGAACDQLAFGGGAGGCGGQGGPGGKGGKGGGGSFGVLSLGDIEIVACEITTGDGGRGGDGGDGAAGARGGKGGTGNGGLSFPHGGDGGNGGDGGWGGPGGGGGGGPSVCIVAPTSVAHSNNTCTFGLGGEGGVGGAYAPDGPAGAAPSGASGLAGHLYFLQ